MAELNVTIKLRTTYAKKLFSIFILIHCAFYENFSDRIKTYTKSINIPSSFFQNLQDFFFQKCIVTKMHYYLNALLPKCTTTKIHYYQNALLPKKESKHLKTMSMLYSATSNQKFSCVNLKSRLYYYALFL